MVWFSIVMAGTQTHPTVGDRVGNRQAGWSECNKTQECFIFFSRIPLYAIMLWTDSIFCINSCIPPLRSVIGNVLTVYLFRLNVM